MKNKKGFTLVEVLAVIVLISLIFGLGAAGLSKLRENSNKRTLNTKINLIESSAQIWGNNNKVLLKNDICNIDGEEYDCYKVPVKTLIEEDILESDKIGDVVFTNPIDNSSMIDNCVYVYKKNNRVYSYYQKDLGIDSCFVDITIPKISLNYSFTQGTNSVYINKIDYSFSDDFNNVTRIEYVEKDNSELPNSEDTITNIISNSYINYEEPSADKYVFFRAVDDFENKSEWVFNNIFINYKYSIDNYDNVNMTVNLPYKLDIKKCTNDKCDSFEGNVNLTNNSFKISEKGNGFYKVTITNDYTMNSIDNIFYLKNFESSSTKSRDDSINLLSATEVIKSFSDYQSPTIEANISDSKLNLSVSGTNYSGGSRRCSCPSGGSLSGGTCTGTSYSVSGGNTWRCGSDGKWSGSWGASSCKTGYTKGTASCGAKPSSGCTPGQSFYQSCTAPCTWKGNYTASCSTSTRYYKYTIGVIVK